MIRDKTWSLKCTSRQCRLDVLSVIDTFKIWHVHRNIFYRSHPPLQIFDSKSCAFFLCLLVLLQIEQLRMHWWVLWWRWLYYEYNYKHSLWLVWPCLIPLITSLSCWLLTDGLCFLAVTACVETKPCTSTTSSMLVPLIENWLINW